MRNGAESPANILVFLSMIPEIITAATPIRYALGATHHAPPKSTEVIKAMTGNLALHGINDVVMTVMRLSLGLSIVLEDIMPGTLQPEPTSIGINDFPERPNFLKMRSRIKAILDIYPHDSSIARNKNKRKI